MGPVAEGARMFVSNSTVLDQIHVGMAGQASSFQYCFWSSLINLISKDTNMVFSICLSAFII